MSTESLGGVIHKELKSLVSGYRKKKYSYFKGLLSSTYIHVGPVLLREKPYEMGCRGFVCICDGKEDVIKVVVGILDPDGLAMSSNGFLITPRGKITPLHGDEYDD